MRTCVRTRARAHPHTGDSGGVPLAGDQLKCALLPPSLPLPLPLPLSRWLETSSSARSSLPPSLSLPLSLSLSLSYRWLETSSSRALRAHPCARVCVPTPAHVCVCARLYQVPRLWRGISCSSESMTRIAALAGPAGSECPPWSRRHAAAGRGGLAVPQQSRYKINVIKAAIASSSHRTKICFLFLDHPFPNSRGFNSIIEYFGPPLPSADSSGGGVSEAGRGRGRAESGRMWRV